MLKHVTFAALVVYILSLIGAALAYKPVMTDQKPARQAVRGVAAIPDPVMGFTLVMHHTANVEEYLRAVDEIAALGFNSLQVITPAYQDNGAAPTIHVDYAPGLSPSREDLLEVLIYARNKGLSTTLTPVVHFTAARGSEWRGKINPERWDPWWRSYREMTDYFVDLAVEADVQAYCVGSQLLTTETAHDNWTSLIRHVRSRFTGKLLYTTNWDRYHIPTFWDQLDYIGVCGYWNLTTLTPAGSSIDPDHLARRWWEIRRRLMDFSKSQGRPVILTEVGYPSLPGALRHSWNVDVSDRLAIADHDTQAAGYRAFLAAWEDLLIEPRRVKFSPRRQAGEAEPKPQAAGSPDAPADQMNAASPGETARIDPLTEDDSPMAQSPQQAVEPLQRKHGFLGFFFYAWDIHKLGGPTDTGYGIRGKPSLAVVRGFMAEHGIEPVTPVLWPDQEGASEPGTRGQERRDDQP